VTSRYPLWDLTHPERTSDIPHSREGDKKTDVQAFGSDTGAAVRGPTDHTHQGAGVPMHEETERRSAKELGIPMPYPTIKPLIVAAGIVIMFSGLLFIHRESKAMAFTLIGTGATMLVVFLYDWLTSPLEDAH
jgi:hypothetical protein